MRGFRLAYTQLRGPIYTYRCYLDRTEGNELSGHKLLKKAIESLLGRVRALSPIEGDTDDEKTCQLMRDLVARLNVEPEAIALEIEKTLKVGWFRRNVGKFWGFVDRKSEVAISAASSTVTEKMLSGF